MKGPDSKAPDIFSNTSLLSMLSRTQSSRSSISKVNTSVSQERLSRKNSEKDNHKALPQSSKRTSPSSSRYRPKEITERISNGPNIYVSVTIIL